MLRFLKIHHLAVIETVEVEFEPGLNVLTGETGAGKSILVGAVSLLLGGRASGELVRTGEDAASVEAIFEGCGEEFVVRREVTAQGRSRAFIDGALVTASALKDLSVRFIELHGQHEHQTLLDPTTHLSTLDAFGALGYLAAPVATAFQALRGVEHELARVEREVADRTAREELARFQAGEIDRAALKPGEPAEDVELAAARQVLASAERVERLCAESYAALYERDGAILAELGGVWRRLGELAALDPQFQPYLNGRDAIKSELEDLALFLRRYAAGIDLSPVRLQQVEERLALLERLKRKYGPTLADVLAKRAALGRELAELERSDERLADLRLAQTDARARFVEAAQALGRARREVAVHFSRRLERALDELAMERTRFDVRFNTEPQAEGSWTTNGTDTAEFFVSPNPGEELRPLSRVVSGGELSRIMLAIKTLTARSHQAPDGNSGVQEGAVVSRGGKERGGQRLAPNGQAPGPGLVFDEVDAGIGGRVADVVGRRLHGLGSQFQVLCITHLPQIAAYADAHFRVDKRIEQGRTRTDVARLDASGRVEELARMLAGESTTDVVRSTARAMLKERRTGRRI